MRKVFLLFLFALCVGMCVQTAFAFYDMDANMSQAEEKKAEAFQHKMESLQKEIQALAFKIAEFNKPAFESQLTKKERSYEELYENPDNLNRKYVSPIVWNRVWAKDKTVVWGEAAKDKKFKAVDFVTVDPELVFSKVIRVGATTKDLERFFNDSISNIGKVNGNKIVLTGPYWGASGFPVAPLLNIVIQDGKVTGIWCMCTGVGDGFYWTVEEVFF